MKAHTANISDEGETMKRVGCLLLVGILLILTVTVVCCVTDEQKYQMQQRTEQWLVGSDPVTEGIALTIGSSEGNMGVAVSNVDMALFGGSAILNWKLSSDTDAGDLLSFVVTWGLCSIRVDNPQVSAGQVTWDVTLSVSFQTAIPPLSTQYHKTVDLPETGYTVVSIPVSWYPIGNAQLQMEHDAVAIGTKAGATNSKECSVEENWISGNLLIHIETPDAYLNATAAGVHDVLFGGSCQVDPDSWPDWGKYAVWVSALKFAGNSVNFGSSYLVRDVSPSPESYHIWEEGVGDTFGWWGDNSGGNYSLTGAAMQPPFSYDFSACQFKWTDDTLIDTDQLIYCTGLRTLNESGVDIGPWHGTIAALHALGRYTQQYGWHNKDPFAPDMQSEVQMYLDMEDAEARGIEIRGPRPQYKVEGAGYGVTVVDEEVIPGPYDGLYSRAGTFNGLPMYSNGYGYLYCLDTEEDDWGLGPGYPVPPYYISVGGGPDGVYTVNLYDSETNPTGYDDDIIDEGTGQRQMSGFNGEGVGPAVSETTEESISVNSDCANPSWEHNATFIFDTHTVAATTRTESPYKTNIARIDPDSSKGIYGNAHDHLDWALENCSDLSVDGEGHGHVTVGAGGGAITLTLKCNYRDRQDKVGELNQVEIPRAMRSRRHDSCLGDGTPAETAEAVYDWRGFYLGFTFKPPSVPTTAKCTVTYYMDLLGCGDNHKTDDDRQDEYTYDPGELFTLIREFNLEWAYPDGDWKDWVPVLVDLYDENNDGQPVAMAASLRWDFATAGEYEFTEPVLLSDRDDRQEGTSVTPFYRQAGAGAGIPAFKVDESWRYSQGVVSMVVDGYSEMALFMPDNSKSCVVERCFDTLDVLIGAKTGEDLTTCYPLSGWPITNSGERVTYTHSQAAEDAAMVDAYASRLKVLNVYDVSPEMNSSGVFNVAVRVHKITCERGIPYSFFGTYYAGGRGHGIVVKDSDDTDFPRARGAGAGSLYRRHLGSEEETDYALAQANISSNGDGYWVSTSHDVCDRTDLDRSLYEYAMLFNGGYHSMGRYATREFAHLQTIATVSGARCLHVDRFGNIFSFYVDAGGVLVYKVRRYLNGSWEGPYTVYTPTGSPQMVCAEKAGNGTFTVGVAGVSSAVVMRRSTDDFGSSTEDAVPINITWDPKLITVSGSTRYIVGFDAGSSTWRCARCMQTGNTVIPFVGGATYKVIASGISGPLGLDSTANAVLAEIPTSASETKLYYSLDGGETWQVDT